MPINKAVLEGTQKEVMFLDFNGSGDICMLTGSETKGGIINNLTFANQDPDEIGSFYPEYNGKPVGTIGPDPKVIMKFTNPKSIDVLVELLLDIKKSIKPKKLGIAKKRYRIHD